MRWIFSAGAAFALAALMGILLAMPAAAETFPDFEQLPARPELPDPLVMFDGTAVKTAADWHQKRKPELKRLFQHYMYGELPAAQPISAREISRDENCLGGKATRREVALSLGPADCPPIHLLIVAPKKRPAGGAPVFVALNFSGNHTVMSDPGIALPTGWMPKGPGVEDNRATAAGRGTAAGLWPIEDIVERGYALATFYYGDVMPDRPDFTGGVYPFFRQGQGPQRGPTEWGAIAAWGWGLQRAVDYVLTDNAFDPRRIVAFGHSRNGKAALVAAAFDDRIAAVIPHQAGCGGSAPSRRKNPKGEPVQRINEVFPHWFDEIFHRFGGHEEQLPFDQHCLVALCAPRAVLFTNGEQDQWADPAGQFDVLAAATPVYRLLGSEGLPDGTSPKDGVLVGAQLNYYVRNAPHLVDKQYWGIFMDFADRVLPPAK